MRQSLNSVQAAALQVGGPPSGLTGVDTGIGCFLAQMKASGRFFALAARVDLHIRSKNARQFENHRALL